LIIHSAKYGAKDKWNDVTQLLRSKISAGRVELRVSNENLGGDPVPGVVKELVLDYSYGGKRSTKKILENETLSLP